ncbi:YezD family protein [Paenibacillus sp. sgz302251]|uniref:YezD family protein n=1 Tax=Paenibacillus sp. sgz302251 TaxID=3414493 RepID=UPI003C7AF73D
MAKPFEADQHWLERIADQVSGISYGQVTITVHDGRIVQIDRTERTRYDGSSQKQAPSEPKQQSRSREAHSAGETLRIVQ